MTAVCEGSRRRRQKGAGGNAIAMTNSSGLEFQARAWRPSTPLRLLLLSNHSTASCTCNFFFYHFTLPDFICSSERLASPRLRSPSVECKGMDSVLNLFREELECVLHTGRGWEQKLNTQACAELPSRAETVLAFAFSITPLAPEVSPGQHQCAINI